jgi:hypothetical protein
MSTSYVKIFNACTVCAHVLQLTRCTSASNKFCNQYDTHATHLYVSQPSDNTLNFNKLAANGKNLPTVGTAARWNHILKNSTQQNAYTSNLHALQPTEYTSASNKFCNQYETHATHLYVSQPSDNTLNFNKLAANGKNLPTVGTAARWNHILKNSTQQNAYTSNLHALQPTEYTSASNKFCNQYETHATHLYVSQPSDNTLNFNKLAANGKNLPTVGTAARWNHILKNSTQQNAYTSNLHALQPTEYTSASNKFCNQYETHATHLYVSQPSDNTLNFNKLAANGKNLPTVGTAARWNHILKNSTQQNVYTSNLHALQPTEYTSASNKFCSKYDTHNKFQ